LERTDLKEVGMANAVTHFEIHGRDGKKAQDFYASLFGW
jgi:predicted enzyme related to lactoylglutathione lyase